MHVLCQGFYATLLNVPVMNRIEYNLVNFILFKLGSASFGLIRHLIILYFEQSDIESKRKITKTYKLF